jgi:hypothetical protein
MLIYNFVSQTILSRNDNSRIYVRIQLGRRKWNYLALLVSKVDLTTTDFLTAALGVEIPLYA